jgi:two-component system NtrC family sensor kinase
MVQTAKLATLREMSAGVAHEINNPMTIIQGNAIL